MSKISFELRADAKDFSGGSVSLPGGTSFDVAKALKDGNGKITLNPIPGEHKSEKAQVEENDRANRDARLAEALMSYPALKLAGSDGGSD